MEHPSRLEKNLQDLSVELAALKLVGGLLGKKGEPQMDTWLQNVESSNCDMDEIQKEVDGMEKEFDEITSLELNMKVIQSLKIVNTLKESALQMFLCDITGDKLKRFSHDDLISFTSNFSKQIGSGGFGNVYRGQFPDGVQVAVKALIQNDGVEEIFMIEVSTMLKASHPNLIKLYGFCFNANMKALVYQFMENGSLDNILYKKPLGIKWEKLYDIAIEIAKALAYLHHGCEDQIIHHDLKPANVLLDTNLSPKVTDFGIARIMSRDVSSFTMTKIRGTRGYTAPEMVLQSSRVTYTCDVFSFGMMLFDFLGMRNNTQNETFLPGKVWDKFRKGKLDETLKEGGISENDIEKARILSAVALWCIQFTPQIRPSMTNVVDALEKELPVTMPPDPSLSWNTDISMQQSPEMNYALVFPSIDKSLPENKYRERQRKESVKVLPRSTLRRFSHGDLQSFTTNFSTIVSSDEFGDVYKGELTNGLQVVVRVLADMDITEDIFIAEVSTMAMTYHPNLIKLYGYCFDGNMKAFVHEYMGSMSLHKILYVSHLNIEWKQLYAIAIETANVISYLHDGHYKRIIHCDINAGNVLLDSNYSPKIKSFELAKQLSKDENHLILTRFRGALGYNAPEMWIQASEVTSKCDVYSFGILLFEILGMRINNPSQTWFPRKVWKEFKNGQLDTLINECGIRGKDREKARVLSRIALWCVQFTPNIRPSMRSVVNVLENEIQVATPPNPFLPSNLELLMQPSREAIYLIFSPSIDERLLENKLREGLENSIPMEFSLRPHINISTEKTPDLSISIQKEGKKYLRKESIETTLSELPTYTLKRFSIEDLKSFTVNFSSKVGSEAVGEVYKGKFPNGVQVLIKVLKYTDIGEDLFMNEMTTMGNIDHPYVVKFYGYCFERNMKAFVHEYVEISLNEILYDKHFEIEWEKLYGIVVDTAKGLSYLHNDSHGQMFHNDVNPRNVLVDSNYFPKITNIASMKLMDKAVTYVSVERSRPTSSYRAPERWMPGSRLTYKCDVYGFGMTLFAVLGKWRNSDTNVWFPKFVWGKFKRGEIEEIMNECGIIEKNRERALVLCVVALWCIQFTPEIRPSMNSVVNILENEIQVTVPPDPFLPSMQVSMRPSRDGYSH